MTISLEKLFTADKQSFKDLIKNQKSIVVFVRHPG